MAAEKLIATVRAASFLRAKLRALRQTRAAAAFMVFAVRIAAAAFAYGAQVLMARMMGGAEYGIFATVWVWIAIVGHSATFGLSQGACRFLPADQARGRLDDARGFLLGGALVSFGGGVVLSLGGLAVAILQGGWLAGPYGSPILVASLVVPLFAFQDYLEGVARSQDWPLLAIAPPYLLRQGLIMIAMVGAVLGGAPAAAWIAIACTLAATGLATALQAGLLLSRLRRRLPPGPRRFRWRPWLSACLPIAAGDLAASAFGFIDVVILGFLVSPAEVGLYFAATRIQQFVAFVHYAASAATAQRLAGARARGDEEGLARLVRDQARWTFLATSVVGLGIVAVSPLLLGLFGSEFRDSLPVLAILVAGSVAASLFGPAEDVLTMLGGERLCAGLTLAMLVLAALLCLTLVPWLGLIGAAVAVALAHVLRGFAMALGARAIHGLSTPVIDFRVRGAGR